jgi:hypothetical protein
MKTANWRKIRNGKITTKDELVWVWGDGFVSAAQADPKTIGEGKYTHWKKIVPSAEPGEPDAEFDAGKAEVLKNMSDAPAADPGTPDDDLPW